MKRLMFGLALVCAAPAAAELMKPAAPVTVRGRISSVAGPVLSIVATNGAKTTVVLAQDARVATVSIVALDAIKPNSFIGTTAEPGPNGTLRATEVHVFPEAMRGAGEGHYPWDTGKARSMTNGNVASMTNGTVGSVGKVGSATKATGGRTLTVAYKGGEQTVFVPANVPVVALGPGTTAQLVPGAHVFTRGIKGADGRLTTSQVAVGIGGIVPPM